MSELIPIINYIPAQLHECDSRWYVRLYAYHPGIKKLHPKVYKLNRISSKTERRKYGRQLVHKLNIKLANGWNPFIEAEAPKSFYELSQAINSFLRDKRNKRPDTLRSYNNFIKLFKDYCTDIFKGDPHIININSFIASRYMERVWNKDISAVRYNNYLGFQILFFNWLIEHQYIKSNPFAAIKKKKVEPKRRLMDIPLEYRRKLDFYLSSTNPQYLAMVNLAFHSLLRPNEIVQLKGKHFDINNQTILIEESMAKNGNSRTALIPDVMLAVMSNALHGVMDNEYVFSKNFMKGKSILHRREVSRYWEDLRNTLRLPKELQFYSLRDAGIIQKLRDGFNPKEVMVLADHSSLEVTNKYVRIANEKPNQEALSRMSKF